MVAFAVDTRQPACPLQAVFEVFLSDEANVNFTPARILMTRPRGDPNKHLAPLTWLMSHKTESYHVTVIPNKQF